MNFKNYVVDESLEWKELEMILNHCEDVMEQRNSDWLKASELRDKVLEIMYAKTHK